MHTSSSRSTGPVHSEKSLFRPDIDRIEGYTPGEQPQEAGWIKLNTNENPYPPSPAVRAAVIAAAEGRLNIYPDPLATAFRKKAAALFGVDPDWVLPGNGSDECLTLITRAFVDPGELVTFPYPSYILYETLGRLAGRTSRAIAAQRRLVLERRPHAALDRAQQVDVRAQSEFPIGKCLVARRDPQANPARRHARARRRVRRFRRQARSQRHCFRNRAEPGSA